jgi:hypothetical protein
MAWSAPSPARSRIPPIGQGIAVVAVVAAIAVLSTGGIAGYLFSLHIAAWGSQNRAIDNQILAKRQEVQRLRNEIDFRTRFPELERWSTPLGLQPADGRQYAQNVHQLDTLAATQRQHIADQLPRVGGNKGYTPQARTQMDSLVGDILN